MTVLGWVNTGGASLLLSAEESVEQVRATAELRGDVHASERLGRIAGALEVERGYEGYAARSRVFVGRRQGPPGATVGWWLAHDPHTRQLRRAAGLSLPDDGIAA